MYVSFYPPPKEKVGPIAQLRRLWEKISIAGIIPLSVLASGIGRAGGIPNKDLAINEMAQRAEA
jgi:hypothetical protein